MIDFHNHVLPNVDDGPKEMSESIKMLKTAAFQGITEVVQTVHFQHPKMIGKNVNYDYLDNKVKDLQNLIDKEKINIKIHLSAEVFYLPNLVELLNNPLVTIGNGKFMLIEFQSNIYPTGFEEHLFELQTKGVTPIIAHPERYRFIQNDIEIIKLWIERGYVIQVDCGSVLGQFGKRVSVACMDMIDKNYIHLIGSDAHNARGRNFSLQESYDRLSNLKNHNFVKKLKKNSYNVLNGLSINQLSGFSDNKNIFIRLKNNLSKLSIMKRLYNDK